MPQNFQGGFGMTPAEHGLPNDPRRAVMCGADRLTWRLGPWTALFFGVGVIVVPAKVAAFGLSADGTEIINNGQICEKELLGVRYDTLSKEGTSTNNGSFPKGSPVWVTDYIVTCPNESPVNVSLWQFENSEGDAFGKFVPFLSAAEQALYTTDMATDPYLVGYSPAGDEYSNPYHAFRYNMETEEMLDLSAARPDESSVARGVSNDGAVVVGWFKSTPDASQLAFRWTEATGLVSLGGLTPDGYSLAYDVSLDGKVIVGEASSVPPAPGEFSHGTAFRWTEADGMVDLGGLEPGRFSSAEATNGDGSVVVGIASTALGGRAFRWESGIMTDLGTVGSDTQSMATSVSADGSVVVGISSDDFITDGGSSIQYSDASHAFRWTAATDTQDLNVLAADAGVDMDGITMISATYVSADGTLISGAAFTPESPDERTAYVLRYEDETTGADGISAGFEDLTLSATDGGGGTGGGGSVDTFTETQAMASLDAASLSLGTAAGQNGAMVAIALDQYASWATPQDFGLAGFATTGGVGSGVRGFAELTDGVTLYGGIAFAQPDFGDVSFGSQTLGALALRYDTTGIVASGAGGTSFVEVIGSMGRIDDLTLVRPYATGDGTATGIGQTQGELSTLGLRAGVLNPVGVGEVLGIAASISKEWLSTDAFAEAATPSNPFPANYAASTSSWLVASVEAQWVRSITPAMELTVTAGWNHAFAADGGLTADFTGIGSVTGSGAGAVNWVDFGGGLTYAVADKTDLSLFVGGTFGADDVTPQAYGGLAVTFLF